MAAPGAPCPRRRLLEQSWDGHIARGHLIAHGEVTVRQSQRTGEIRLKVGRSFPNTPLPQVTVCGPQQNTAGRPQGACQP